ncbi:hypothetical protein FQA39_LY08583 [Lamprigera yunnana]|nr:hypothetical protein FQA39_LY08583 [Lamprigera yunnana]
MAAWSSGLPLMLFFAFTYAAPLSEHTEIGSHYPTSYPNGCYYNFQHYDEGDRILTNEPCLNCTCHNDMLMCYLRVCPFTKAIGQDCKVEKRPDQCCPTITCPEVPVKLMSSTTPSTAVGHVNEYGCFIDNLFYTDGARVPSNPNKPCELCYCIRNRTACVMQECTLRIEGCKPVYQEGVCCPAKYDCEYPEQKLLETTTTERTTLSFLTTTVLPTSQACVFDNEVYADGAFIKRDVPCQHCYCMRGNVVCAVQKCNPTPLEKINCTAVPPAEGECCTDSYDCDNIIEKELTTLGYQLTTIQPSDDENEIEQDFSETKVPELYTTDHHELGATTHASSGHVPKLEEGKPEVSELTTFSPTEKVTDSEKETKDTKLPEIITEGHQTSQKMTEGHAQVTEHPEKLTTIKETTVKPFDEEISFTEFPEKQTTLEKETIKPLEGHSQVTEHPEKEYEKPLEEKDSVTKYFIEEEKFTVTEHPQKLATIEKETAKSIDQEEPTTEHPEKITVEPETAKPISQDTLVTEHPEKVTINKEETPKPVDQEVLVTEHPKTVTTIEEGIIKPDDQSIPVTEHPEKVATIEEETSKAVDLGMSVTERPEKVTTIKEETAKPVDQEVLPTEHPETVTTIEGETSKSVDHDKSVTEHPEKVTTIKEETGKPVDQEVLVTEHPKTVTTIEEQTVKPVYQDTSVTEHSEKVTSIEKETTKPEDQEVLTTEYPKSVTTIEEEISEPVDQNTSVTEHPEKVTTIKEETAKPVDQEVVTTEHPETVTTVAGVTSKSVDHDKSITEHPEKVTTIKEETGKPVDQEVLVTEHPKIVTTIEEQTVKLVDQDTSVTEHSEKVTTIEEGIIKPDDQSIPVTEHPEKVTTIEEETSKAVDLGMSVTERPEKVTTIKEETAKPVDQEVLPTEHPETVTTIEGETSKSVDHDKSVTEHPEKVTTIKEETGKPVDQEVLVTEHPKTVTTIEEQTVKPVYQDTSVTEHSEKVTSIEKETTKPEDQEVLTTEYPKSVTTIEEEISEPVDQNTSVTEHPEKVTTIKEETAKPVDQEVVTTEHPETVTTVAGVTSKSVDHDKSITEHPEKVTTIKEETGKPVDQEVLVTEHPKIVTTIEEQTVKLVDQDTSVTEHPQKVTTVEEETPKSDDEDTSFTEHPEKVTTIEEETAKPVDQEVLVTEHPKTITIEEETAKPINQLASITEHPEKVTTVEQETAKPVNQEGLVTKPAEKVTTAEEKTTKSVNQEVSVTELPEKVTTIEKETATPVNQEASVTESAEKVRTAEEGTTKSVDQEASVTEHPKKVTTIEEETPKPIDKDTPATEPSEKITTIEEDTTEPIDQIAPITEHFEKVTTTKGDTEKTIDQEMLVTKQPEKVTTTEEDIAKPIDQEGQITEQTDKVPIEEETTKLVDEEVPATQHSGKMPFNEGTIKSVDEETLITEHPQKITTIDEEAPKLVHQEVPSTEQPDKVIIEEETPTPVDKEAPITEYPEKITTVEEEATKPIDKEAPATEHPEQITTVREVTPEQVDKKSTVTEYPEKLTTIKYETPKPTDKEVLVSEHPEEVKETKPLDKELSITEHPEKLTTIEEQKTTVDYDEGLVTKHPEKLTTIEEGTSITIVEIAPVTEYLEKETIKPLEGHAQVTEHPDESTTFKGDIITPLATESPEKLITVEEKPAKPFDEQMPVTEYPEKETIKPLEGHAQVTEHPDKSTTFKGDIITPLATESPDKLITVEEKPAKPFDEQMPVTEYPEKETIKPLEEHAQVTEHPEIVITLKEEMAKPIDEKSKVTESPEKQITGEEDTTKPLEEETPVTEYPKEHTTVKEEIEKAPTTETSQEEDIPSTAEYHKKETTIKSVEEKTPEKQSTIGDEIRPVTEHTEKLTTTTNKFDEVTLTELPSRFGEEEPKVTDKLSEATTKHYLSDDITTISLDENEIDVTLGPHDSETYHTVSISLNEVDEKAPTQLTTVDSIEKESTTHSEEKQFTAQSASVDYTEFEDGLKPTSVSSTKDFTTVSEEPLKLTTLNLVERESTNLDQESKQTTSLPKQTSTEILIENKLTTVVSQEPIDESKSTTSEREKVTITTSSGEKMTDTKDVVEVTTESLIELEISNDVVDKESSSTDGKPFIKEDLKPTKVSELDEPKPTSTLLEENGATTENIEEGEKHLTNVIPITTGAFEEVTISKEELPKHTTEIESQHSTQTTFSSVIEEESTDDLSESVSKHEIEKEVTVRLDDIDSIEKMEHATTASKMEATSKGVTRIPDVKETVQTTKSDIFTESGKEHTTLLPITTINEEEPMIPTQILDVDNEVTPTKPELDDRFGEGVTDAFTKTPEEKIQTSIAEKESTPKPDVLTTVTDRETTVYAESTGTQSASEVEETKLPIEIVTRGPSKEEGISSVDPLEMTKSESEFTSETKKFEVTERITSQSTVITTEKQIDVEATTLAASKDVTTVKNAEVTTSSEAIYTVTPVAEKKTTVAEEVKPEEEQLTKLHTHMTDEAIVTVTAIPIHTEMSEGEDVIKEITENDKEASHTTEALYLTDEVTKAGVAEHTSKPEIEVEADKEEITKVPSLFTTVTEEVTDKEYAGTESPSAISSTDGSLYSTEYFISEEKNTLKPLFSEKEQSTDRKPEPEYISEVGEVTSQPDTTVPETTTSHVVPGEGSCLVDGQTYGNNTNVPPINHCQISCTCVSSILQCTLVNCSPAPSNLHNCMPLYHGPDSCCPTYSCTVPDVSEIESDSHKLEETTLKEQSVTMAIQVLPAETEATTTEMQFVNHSTLGDFKEYTTLPPSHVEVKTKVPLYTTVVPPQEEENEVLATRKPEDITTSKTEEHVTLDDKYEGETETKSKSHDEVTEAISTARPITEKVSEEKLDSTSGQDVVTTIKSTESESIDEKQETAPAKPIDENEIGNIEIEVVSSTMESVESEEQTTKSQQVPFTSTIKSEEFTSTRIEAESVVPTQKSPDSTVQDNIDEEHETAHSIPPKTVTEPTDERKEVESSTSHDHIVTTIGKEISTEKYKPQQSEDSTEDITKQDKSTTIKSAQPTISKVEELQTTTYSSTIKEKDYTTASHIVEESTSQKEHVPDATVESEDKTEVHITTESKLPEPEVTTHLPESSKIPEVGEPTEILRTTQKPLDTTTQLVLSSTEQKEFVSADSFSSLLTDAITNRTEMYTSTTQYPTMTESTSAHPDFPEHSPEVPDYHVPPEDEYEEEDHGTFGPGTCRYGGKMYVSAQQILRDDPCDFCFCFRSDIICLQQSCPPPIPRCHEEPIRGFCCPRYECPVSMATSVNVTTTTTTTTTTLPPIFFSHAYKGRATRQGCQIRGKGYQVGDDIPSSSGPCLQCRPFTMAKTIGIIIIGDEILSGCTVDTNSKYMFTRLHNLGVRCKKVSIIGDVVDEISEEVKAFSKNYDYVITTGGIGPTHDDVTFEAVAKAFDEPIILHPQLVKLCREFYKTDDINSPGMKLAKVPQSSVLTFLEDHSESTKPSYPNISVRNVYIFPGIPQLFEKAFDTLSSVLFKSSQKFYTKVVYFNVTEDKIAASLTDITKEYPRVLVGSYPELFNKYYKVKIMIESIHEEETTNAYEKLLKIVPQESIVKM